MRIYGKWSVRMAAEHYGWLLAVAAMVAAMGLVAITNVNPVEEVASVPLGLVRSPATVRCLAGWTETTGTDPDGQINLKVCTSVDKRYVITVREGQKPVGFDGGTGNFLTDDETADFLR